MSWQSIQSAPQGFDNYVLVRPKGISNRTGEKYVPTTVMIVDDECFRPDNELDPITWGCGQSIKDGHSSNINDCPLEWHVIPE